MAMKPFSYVYAVWSPSKTIGLNNADVFASHGGCTRESNRRNKTKLKGAEDWRVVTYKLDAHAFVFGRKQ